MALHHDVPEGKDLVSSLLTTDFCPWANRFVYWLKEPVGWFVLATAVSIVFGLYVSPIGWTLAASLASLIAFGMLWPAFAVRAVGCALSPDKHQVHEGDSCEIRLAVRNHWPLPIWGLAVEGYLDRGHQIADEAEAPTIALAFVRAMATSTYRILIRPELRGLYPNAEVVLTCSFPFGIWTAKQKLRNVTPITVWPKIYPIAGQSAMNGRKAAESGEGLRIGRAGDFLGLREYRQGDCMRQVNWIATARSGDLVVTELSGPQCPDLLVIIETRNNFASSEELADRIRVAASLLAKLHQSAVPLRVHLGKQCHVIKRGPDGFVQLMDLLAAIPTGGCPDSLARISLRETTSIMISSNSVGNVTICISDPTGNPRSSDRHTHRVIDRYQDLSIQLLMFWEGAAQ